MLSLNRWHIAFVVAWLGFTGQSRATVIVRFDPPAMTVDRNAEPTFVIDIVADIPDPVVGWGLDLTIQDPAIISQVGFPVLGALWSPAYAPDGDKLAALAFPDSISGAGILLATITFSADALGEKDVIASITASDLTEGFPLDPTGFADVTFEGGHVRVIPEPTTMILLAMLGLLGLRWPRERRPSFFTTVQGR